MLRINLTIEVNLERFIALTALLRVKWQRGIGSTGPFFLA